MTRGVRLPYRLRSAFGRPGSPPVAPHAVAQTLDTALHLGKMRLVALSSYAALRPQRIEDTFPPQ